MVNRRRRLPILFAGLLLGLACHDRTEPEQAYRLPAAYLYIEPDAMADLGNSLFSNRRVDARFVYQNKEYDVEVRNHGELGRFFLKKSYELNFPEEQPFESRAAIILSSQYLDSSLIRSRLAADVFRHGGFMVFDAWPVALFLNGDYRGVYHMVEPVDEHFFQRRNTSPGNCYKAIRRNAKFTLVGIGDIRCSFEKQPDDGDYRDLEYLIEILDTAPAESLPVKLAGIIDVEDYLRYLALSVLTVNTDGFEHNFFIRRTTHDRFRFIPWDLDKTFDDADWTPWGFNHLTERLLEVPEYLAYYKRYLGQQIETEFREDRIVPRIDELTEEIREAYQNDPYTIAKGWDLDRQADAVKDFVRNRRNFLRTQLQIQ